MERLNQDESEHRDLLFEYIREEEHSDLPIKIFRVISSDDADRLSHLNIEAKTKLGGLLSLADWKLMNLGQTGDWKYYYEKFVYGYNRDLDRLEEFVDDIIKEKVRKQGEVFSMDNNEIIVEITQFETINPFNQTPIKGAT